MIDDGTVIGPEMGALIGIKMGDVRARADSQVASLGDVRQQLKKRRAEVVVQQACAMAAADVMATVLAELRGDQAVNLSAPAARDARNAEYANLAAKHVTMLSGGQEMLQPGEVAFLAAQKPIR